MTDGIKRRDFLKVLGVSGAGATMTGCGGEVERLLPYVVAPEEITPGVATWYATACGGCSAGFGASVWQLRHRRLSGSFASPGSLANKSNWSEPCGRWQFRQIPRLSKSFARRLPWSCTVPLIEAFCAWQAVQIWPPSAD